MSKRAKPKKPRADYPLYPHNNGQWCKRIKGKLRYFGPWNDPAGAEAKYLDEREYYQAGRMPPTLTDGITVHELCNTFLQSKRLKLQNGEIRATTFADYRRACVRIVEGFGEDFPVLDLGPEHFTKLRAAMNKTLGVVAQGNRINEIRMVFGFGYDQGLIDRPVRFGEAFTRPSTRAMRRDKQARQSKHGKRMFSATELRTILDAAADPMRAFVLLGINCGFGATDISELTASAITGEWIEYPRIKTAEERRIHLWPETLEAIAAAPERIAKDPDCRRLFVTRHGHEYVRMSVTGSRNDGIGAAFRILLTSLGLKRPGLGHYALRHTFETVGGEVKDQIAVDSLMGHISGQRGAYIEEISDERLKAVTDHIRGWLGL